MSTISFHGRGTGRLFWRSLLRKHDMNLPGEFQCHRELIRVKGPNTLMPTLIIATTIAGTFSPALCAYVGPGLGAGTAGVIVGIIVSIFLALFAVFWYPLKRLLKRRGRRVVGTPDSEGNTNSDKS